MSTIEDYEGRTIDVLAFSGVKEVGDQKLVPVLFSEDSSGLVCTGIQKLAQRFLLELLTAKGSMKGLEDRGCNLVIDMHTGRITSDVHATSAFEFAASTVVTNLQREASADDPADERISEVNLLSVAFLPGYVSYRVKVVSEAGTEREVVLPISMVP